MNVMPFQATPTPNIQFPTVGNNSIKDTGIGEAGDTLVSLNVQVG
jgi:hypothetical protein